MPTNYIIGASLVGGDIAGTKSQKSIFISVGLLILCLGLLSFTYCANEEKMIDKISIKESESEISLEEENIHASNDADSQILDNSSEEA